VNSTEAAEHKIIIQRLQMCSELLIVSSKEGCKKQNVVERDRAVAAEKTLL